MPFSRDRCEAHTRSSRSATSLAELTLSDAHERATLLELARGARTRRPLPLLRRIERAITARPGATAVEGEDTALAYAELSERAYVIEQRLRDAGVRRGARVGLAVERSPDAVVALLGILRAGAAYVPLDASYPRELLALILRDAKVSAVLVDDPAVDRLPDARAPLVRVDLGRHPVGHHVPNPPGPEDLAYVCYRSSSTDRPQGVAMTHRCLDGMLDWQLRELNRRGRTAQLAPLTSDVALQEIATALAGGGTLVIVPERLRSEGTDLACYLRRRALTRIFLPVVVLEALAEAIAADNQSPTLREVITTGEGLRITPAIIAMFERIEDGWLENQYRATETHVVSARRLTGEPRDWPLWPTIGYAIDGADVHVLDERLEPVAIDLPGEIHVGGASVARGYLAQPRLTAERFIPDPHALEPGGRLYRTGDIGCRRDDGSIEVLRCRTDRAG